MVTFQEIYINNFKKTLTKGVLGEGIFPAKPRFSGFFVLGDLKKHDDLHYTSDKLVTKNNSLLILWKGFISSL